MDNLITLALAGGAALYFFKRKKTATTPAPVNDAPVNNLPVDAPPAGAPPIDTTPGGGSGLPTGTNTASTELPRARPPFSAWANGIVCTRADGLKIFIELRGEGTWEHAATNPNFPGKTIEQVQAALDARGEVIGGAVLKGEVRRGIKLSQGDVENPIYTDAQAVLLMVDVYASEGGTIGTRLEAELQKRMKATTNAQHRALFGSLLDQLTKLWVVELTSALLRRDLLTATTKIKQLRAFEGSVGAILDRFDTQPERAARARLLRTHGTAVYQDPTILRDDAQITKPITLQALLDTRDRIKKWYDSPREIVNGVPKTRWPWTSTYSWDAHAGRLMKPSYTQTYTNREYPTPTNPAGRTTTETRVLPAYGMGYVWGLNKAGDMAEIDKLIATATRMIDSPLKEQADGTLLYTMANRNLYLQHAAKRLFQLDNYINRTSPG
jgi:hypothetical protein